MSFNPKVSIVIPVYNGANYMREAIDSVLAQTYDNCEVIVVNDGSNDNGKTDAIARSYGERIRYFQKENGGVATALNLGIEMMHGEYFSWLSHDDIYYPEKIKVQIDFIAGMDDKCVIVFGDWDSIDERSNRRGIVKLDQEHSIEMLNYSLYPIVNGLIHGCTLLIPKSCFGQVGLFNPNLKTTQDYDMVFRLARHYSYKYLPGLYIKSRVHNEQSRYSLDYINEGNLLWSRILEELTPNEIAVMDKSVFNFFISKADFFFRIGYREAAQRAMELAEVACSKKSVDATEGPLISIVIPFLNRISMVYDAIESIQKQTYTNYEIILVDDGSNENIDLGTISSNKVRYYRQNNQGPSVARNYGMRMAHGEYIAFLDCDDMFFPNKLEEQLAYMQRHLDAFFSHTSYIRIDKDKNYQEQMKTGIFKGNVYPQMLLNCPISPSTVMIKKELVDEGFLFPEDIRLGEDTIYYISIARKYSLHGIEIPLSKVRIHDSNTTANLHNLLNGHMNILKYASDTDSKLPVTLKREFLANIYNAVSELYRRKGGFFLSAYYFSLGKYHRFRMLMA